MQRRLAVPDGDHEAGPDEDEDLAELDVVALGEPGALENDEERIAVDLELRPLVGIDGVLDGQLVEIELALCRLELGHGRVQEADPGERPVFTDRLVGVLDGQIARKAVPVLVDSAIDDHAPIVQDRARVCE